MSERGGGSDKCVLSGIDFCRLNYKKGGDPSACCLAAALGMTRIYVGFGK